MSTMPASCMPLLFALSSLEILHRSLTTTNQFVVIFMDTIRGLAGLNGQDGLLTTNGLAFLGY